MLGGLSVSVESGLGSGKLYIGKGKGVLLFCVKMALMMFLL